MKLLKELEKDFSEFVKEINPDCYDPCSGTFLKALFIGQMAETVRALCKPENDMFGGIEEELEGAEHYLGLYEETGDTSYKEMSGDELRHAGILIKKHLAKTTDADVRRKLNWYEEKRQEISRKTEKPSSRE